MCFHISDISGNQVVQKLNQILRRLNKHRLLQNIAFRNHLLININIITDIGHMNQCLLSIYLPCIVIKV